MSLTANINDLYTPGTVGQDFIRENYYSGVSAVRSLPDMSTTLSTNWQSESNTITLEATMNSKGSLSRQDIVGESDTIGCVMIFDLEGFHLYKGIDY